MIKLLFVFIAFNALAGIQFNGDGLIIKNNKVDLKELAKVYANYKELNLVFPPEFKSSSIEVYGKNRVEKFELEKFISNIFFEQGYTFLMRDNLLQVINSRDIRYKSVPMYNKITEVPKTYNVVQFTLATEHIPSRDISRNLRPFMGRYGRIIDESNGQSIVIQDSALNIHRVYQIIKTLDTTEYGRLRADLDEVNKSLNPELVYEESFTDVIADQNILFIVLFSLLSLVIGFGIRGYMMKRIEGGW